MIAIKEFKVKWRNVIFDFYQTNYQISNTGLVWDTKKNKIVKTRYNEFGYEVVTLKLSENLTKTQYISKKVHRLVAIAFIANPKGKRTVNHKDGNKTNNYSSNLE